MWEKAKEKNSLMQPVINIKEKREAIGRCSKGQFSKIRHISKEVCRILRLWLQMQCLSGKLISYR